jgi:3-hydroxyacyl-CoA dehydrogenase
MQTMNYTLDHGFTVEEVDAVTGPLIGRPKTATFRLNDLVGFDVAVHVARNLYPAIPDDPAREVLAHAKATALSDRMLAENRLGGKTGQGFFKEVRVDGKKEFWVMNLETFEYEPPQNPTVEIAQKHRKLKNTGQRIKALIAEQDRFGQFLFHIHAFYLAYASQRVPEITDTIVNVDNAQKWGFSHEMGPFEIWDAIGVAETIPQFEAAGYPVAQWVKEMVGKGINAFYRQNAQGLVDGYYSAEAGGYVPLVKDRRDIKSAALKASGKRLGGTGSGSIHDMGDGVLLWEFHSPASAIDADLVESGYKALEMLESGPYQAMVVGHDGERWCIGANGRARRLHPQATTTGPTPALRLQTCRDRAVQYGAWRRCGVAAIGRAYGGAWRVIRRFGGAWCRVDPGGWRLYDVAQACAESGDGIAPER